VEPVTGLGRKVLVGALLGAALGVLVGLLLGRFFWPWGAPVSEPSWRATDVPEPVAVQTPAATPDRSSDHEGVVLVSALYAVDGDLERARERLAVLGIANPAAAMADLVASQVADGCERLAADLAALAVALGHPDPALAAYAMTVTPASTPTAPPTEAPTPSVTYTLPPSPTASSAPSPSPEPTATNTPVPPRPQPLPAASATPTAAAVAATPLPLVWDRRVDVLDSPVRLVEAEVAPGQTYWRLVRLEWWTPAQGGNMLIYVTTLNENGQPVWGQEVVVENGGHTPLYTQPKPGEPYGVNFTMGDTLNSYQVFVGGSLPSDRVTGLGLGEWLGGKDHTSFVLVFQRGRK
jgi:hypothetical protein